MELLNQKPVSQTLKFEKACKLEAIFYFRNVIHNSDVAPGQVGDIIIGLLDPDSNKNLVLAIPKNSYICVNEQVPVSLLKTNTDIRNYLRRGAIEIYTEEEYEEIIKNDPKIQDKSAKELKRLMGLVLGERSQVAPKATKPVIADSSELNLRAAIISCFNKAQFEQEEEDILISDLKANEPITEIEKEYLKQNVSSVSSAYSQFKAYITDL